SARALRKLGFAVGVGVAGVQQQAVPSSWQEVELPDVGQLVAKQLRVASVYDLRDFIEILEWRFARHVRRQEVVADILVEEARGHEAHPAGIVFPAKVEIGGLQRQ